MFTHAYVWNKCLKKSFCVIERIFTNTPGDVDQQINVNTFSNIYCTSYSSFNQTILGLFYNPM